MCGAGPARKAGGGAVAVGPPESGTVTTHQLH